MSDADTDPELTALLSDLTGTLRELQEEAEPDRRPRLPSPETLSQFTSEVAIPGLILVLETNIRSLQLLRRAIRIADGRDPSPDGTVADVRSRAEEVGQATLRQLEGSLDELQSALEERPPDDEARQLLSRARELQEEVTQQLDAERTAPSDSDADGDVETVDRTPDDGSESVSIDVESELQTIKENLDQKEEDGEADSVDTSADGTDERNRDGADHSDSTDETDTGDHSDSTDGIDSEEDSDHSSDTDQGDNGSNSAGKGD